VTRCGRSETPRVKVLHASPAIVIIAPEGGDCSSTNAWTAATDRGTATKLRHPGVRKGSGRGDFVGLSTAGRLDQHVICQGGRRRPVFCHLTCEATQHLAHHHLSVDKTTIGAPRGVSRLQGSRHPSRKGRRKNSMPNSYRSRVSQPVVNPFSASWNPRAQPVITLDNLFDGRGSPRIGLLDHLARQRHRKRQKVIEDRAPSAKAKRFTFPGRS